VVIDRGALADADQAVVLELDDQDGLVRRDAAGDLERLGEDELLDPGAQLHGRNPTAGAALITPLSSVRPPP